MKNTFDKLKQIMVGAMLTVMLSLPALAQDMRGFKDKTPEQRAQMQTGLMKSKLQLDSQQETKVQAINLKYALKMEPILKSDDNRMTRMRAAMAIQKDKDNELKGVFNAKQYQEYEKELKEKVMAKMN
jgi:hypothetical protein